ncbi:MAG TPA: SCP2 sterol-binding domain-containing protein [Solirubrobacteraceae bacterium]|nr:SCP2 sterol-binding domain-containing protein [Solirubrobacteraceae bacterium]
MRARLIERIARLDRLRWVHWIVLRVLPQAITRRFVAPADGLQATLELAIRDPGGREPARFALAVADGGCRIRPGAADRPAARATVAADDLIRLAGGAATWPELLSSGRFELSGDPFLALRFATLFRLPVELEPIR